MDVDGTGGDADGAQDLASGLPPAEGGGTAAAAAGALQSVSPPVTCTKSNGFGWRCERANLFPASRRCIIHSTPNQREEAFAQGLISTSEYEQFKESKYGKRKRTPDTRSKPAKKAAKTAEGEALIIHFFQSACVPCCLPALYRRTEVFFIDDT